MQPKTTTNPTSGWASVKSLALHYDVHTKTIWQWTREGKLPQPVKLSNGCTRWRWSEVLTTEGAA